MAFQRVRVQALSGTSSSTTKFNTMSREEEKSESFTVDVVGMREKPDDFVLLKEENRKAAERHVVRKLDMRLMPTVAIIYLMNYIDVSQSLSQLGSGVDRSVVARVDSVLLSLPLDFKV